jgi:hypothetical protein
MLNLEEKTLKFSLQRTHTAFTNRWVIAKSTDLIRVIPTAIAFMTISFGDNNLNWS